ncbi:hypothetical protein [Poseidonibacter lekithochrous]|uniref:hypothetical protein n=1 Tax=Poseidonibacter lekithochrous TaxID=1904463 RepID=UPI0008FCAD3A|nr:hypothetical protein [Poseidonibacter lekithochrous]QKJ24532.1 hypothetical protein ALEK_3328 [Poseidonibacter lekithochrous]
MNILLSLLEEQNLRKNLCYRDYKVVKNTIVIIKSNEMYSSSIETKELVDLSQAFKRQTNIEFTVLENGDINIKKVS